ncbi:unnamed protein product [Rhizoctonia solani]|uniref:Nephrocystin 3-like N-terminal domain-containing protein n=1 Tax=Rhizoctonia solani TaxID=456999 RepID=A0A8H3GG87_9AGAM|nr:unnamed protein product [Rhizoctonia solani]
MSEECSRKHSKKTREQDVTQSRSRATSLSSSSTTTPDPAVSMVPGNMARCPSVVGQPMPPSLSVDSSANINITTPPEEDSPGPSAPKTALRTWTNLKSLAKTLAPIGPIKAVAEELMDCVRIYESVSKGKEEYALLKGQLEDIFMDIKSNLISNPSPTVTSSVKSLCSSITQELAYVKTTQEKNRLKRSLESGEVADNVLACYRRIQIHVSRLSLNLNISTQKSVDEIVAENRLKNLAHAPSARYNSAQSSEVKRGECTSGTRVDVFSHISGWLHNNMPGCIYWLNGMAGTGKTTISYSLCAQLDTNQRLAASFFCSRLLPECRDVNRIIPSIAYQLARYSHPFKVELLNVLEEDPDAHTRLPYTQFNDLIIEPLTKCRDSLPLDLVVVIDALDECDNKDGTGSILDVLITQALGLPVKFFVSSRPEPAIRDQMSKAAAEQASSRLVLHELDKTIVQADVETYLRVALIPINPSDTQIAALAARAGVLFIYAATAVRYIGYDNFRRDALGRLRTVLDSSNSTENKNKEIDRLYAVILRDALDDPNLDLAEKTDMKRVLNTIICAREPLTTFALSGLLKMRDNDRVDAALRPLWSVLHVVEPTKLVTPLHVSFSDYMFDQTRSHQYYCDPELHNHFLTELCFESIQDTQPQFNICQLESSYLKDSEVEDLDERINKTVSTELFYACRYWAAHLTASNGSPQTIQSLRFFITNCLLLWMEIMNLKKCMDKGTEALRMVEVWSRRLGHSKNIVDLVYDAWRFSTTVISNPVSQSTPHIYISVLAFWPRLNPMTKYYATQKSNMVGVGGTATGYQHPLLAKWTVGGDVSCGAFSPDGTIAVGVGNSIHIIDTLSGQRLLEPLEGHIRGVSSLAYSTDGVYIASGSADTTVCMWDARSGQLTLGPLKKHTKRVSSICFSPDNNHIASSSNDSSICVWEVQHGTLVYSLVTEDGYIPSIRYSPDGNHIAATHGSNIWILNAHTGYTVLGPLAGHLDNVRSIGYSPDGSYIASGSNDNTIRIWSTTSAQSILNPISICDKPTSIVVVKSIEYSQDGTRIIVNVTEGLHDNDSIRVYDARTGQPVLGPLQGHSNTQSFACFSPDGTLVVSGDSLGENVWVWDARSGKQEHEVVSGHTGRVESVGWSPDDIHIVSGSADKTICVWDTQNGNLVLGPLTGHNDNVVSVEYSPDGTHFVSGSWDTTIRTWDAQNGHTILGPLTGHVDKVVSVRYSPNGTLIASGSLDSTICVWHAKSGEMVLGPINAYRPVCSVGFSPNSACIVSGAGRQAYIWDAQTGKLVVGAVGGYSTDVTCVEFSPNGAHVASSLVDGTIHIWSAQTGRLVLGPLQRHKEPVLSVTYSPDGSRIASGSRSGSICVWDAQTGHLIIDSLKGHAPIKGVLQVRYSPDGTRVATGSVDMTIRVWDVKNSDGDATHAKCELNADGWLVDDGSSLLFWIPPHLHRSLMHPRETLLISRMGYTRLEVDGASVGDSWINCYQQGSLPKSKGFEFS